MLDQIFHPTHHFQTCELLPGTDCEGCDYELHEAVKNFTEGRWLSFSWLAGLGEVRESKKGWSHDPCYDNIGWWRVNEDDYRELGRRVAMELDFQGDGPGFVFNYLNQDGTPKHPDDYMWKGRS